MNLVFPVAALTQHIVVLGKTGAGKSSALRHVAENRLDHHKRVCIIDPKGDWWGLKSSADGKSAGYAVIAFGDFKEPKASDVPINAHSGKHVAELVATGNRPCIIGFRGWMPSAMTQFWIDFASTLFNCNAGELYLFIDEVHNFAPKGRVMDPAAGKSLHWANRIMSEGRGIGLVCAIASQRPQKVHNDTLTCCETLIAMRVVHAADRQAIKDWIDGCGDDSGNEVLKNAASLARGEGYVWSPEVPFGPTRVKFPMFSTFDSFAPPQLQRKVSDSGWADVDLGAVKEKLAAVIEEAKANDPAHLKAELGKLRVELGKLKADSDNKPAAAPAPAQRVEVPILSVADRQLIEKAISVADGFPLAFKQAAEHMAGVRQELQALLQRVTAATAAKHVITPQVRTMTMRSNPNVPAPSRDPARHQILTNAPLAKAERCIVNAMAQRHPKPTSKSQAAILSGYSVTSSTFSNALSALRVAGLIDGGGDALRLTNVGVIHAGEVTRPKSAEEVQAHWLGRLGKAERAILQLAIDAYPAALPRSHVAAVSGYSETSSTFSNALSQLRVLELITRDRDVRATENLFEA